MFDGKRKKKCFAHTVGHVQIIPMKLDEKCKKQCSDKSYSALCGRKFIWLLHQTSHYFLISLFAALEISLVVAETEKSL